MSLKENALQNTLYGFVAGIGFSVGPVIGGYLTAVSFFMAFLYYILLTSLCRSVGVGALVSLFPFL